MKKILMVFLMLFILLTASKVEAQDFKLTKIDQDGIYFVRTGGTIPDKVGKFAIYYLGDNLAYCIDPSKSIRTEDYISADGFVDLPYSDELKEKLELIGYYGREYPGHNTVRYSMAAQSLIWEAIGGQTVTFWTGPNGTGSEIDISYEKTAIMLLVNKHKQLPIISKEINAHLKREISFHDGNQVLNEYEVINNNSGNQITITGDTLKIIPTVAGEFTFTLKHKRYDNLRTMIFVGKDNNDTQALGRLRFSADKEMNIKLKVNTFKLMINKADENNKLINLPDVKFRIKNLITGNYLCETHSCIYATNMSGYFETNYLDYGEYEIEEVENQVIPGYTWNPNKVKIKVDENTTFKWGYGYNYVSVYFPNNKVKGIITIYKKGEKAVFDNNEIKYEEINLPNFEFDLYNNSNQLLKTIKTDSNGKGIITDGPIGDLYILEKTDLKEYVKNNEKKEFNLTQKDQYTESISITLNIKNYLKKGSLEFTKKDSVTETGISDTLIEIYNDENKLLLTRKTDKDGKISVNNLPFGKYYIKEKEANYWYSKTKELIPFEIKENGEIVKVSMTNEKAKGNLEIYKYGEKQVIENNEVIYSKITLSGIEFDLFNNNDELIDTLVTDKNGYIKKELELGKYYFVEKTKMENYQDNNKKYSFEIKKNNDEVVGVKYNIDNYLRKGKLVFNKEDYYTGEGVDDTIIEIYNDKDELLLTKKTNKDGKIVLDNLVVGKYYIKEKESNYYYQKTDEIKSFMINKNDEIVKVKMTNKKIVGILEVFKKGEKYQIIDNDFYYEKSHLANIEFNIYCDNDELVGSFKTNKDGYFKYESLPLGKYYLIEKTKLNNYLVSSDKIYFEIKKDGNNAIDAMLEVINYLKKGDLEFEKKDLITNEGIANTIIEIYDNKNNLLVTRETDENGKIIINNLPYGKYYILEKEANSMYQMTNEKVYFDIKENGVVVRTKMTNEKKNIKVPKTKTSESTIVKSLFGISILIGLGRLYYERKKAN